jgi:hypothetical protein
MDETGNVIPWVFLIAIIAVAYIAMHFKQSK